MLAVSVGVALAVWMPRSYFWCMACRICLKRFGIIDDDDHVTLVIRMFW